MGANGTRWRRRVAYWLAYRRRRQWLDEELVFHVESMVEEQIAQGVPEREARAMARRRFGDMTRTAEDARAAWIARWWTDFLQDLRLAVRAMRRDAAYATFVILIAGLGIGASATVFSVVNAMLLRPLPFRDPAALLWIANHGVQTDEEWTTQVGYVADLRASAKSLVELAGWDNFYYPGDSELTGLGEPERVTSVPVTQNLFSLLGVEPAIGRFFTPDECTQSSQAPPAVILSHGFFVRRFAADTSVVGRALVLNGGSVVVVGVLPASFDFSTVFTPGVAADVFVPWPLTAQTNQQGNTTRLIGRLRPGATVTQARAELLGLAPTLTAQHRDRNPWRPVVTPLAQRVSGSSGPALLVLAAAVSVVMLIVCANLSNLQLARLGERGKEMAMRVALGAGRFRLIRQLLTESLVLSVAGAGVGLGLAWLGTRELAQLTALKLPLLTAVGIDGRVVAVALGTAVLTAVLFGILPALRVRSIGVSTELKDGARGSTRGGVRWVRGALVVSEIALACLLLVATGLLARSFLRVLDVNLGFQPTHLEALRVDPSFRLQSLDHRNAFLDELLATTRAMPGVEAAGITDALPFAGDRGWSLRAAGKTYAPGTAPEAYIRVVTDGYLETAGVVLREGRLFLPQDRASTEKVGIVNETLARALWPGEDAIGQKLTMGNTIVGVVADVRHVALEDAAGSELYLPMRQGADYASMQLVMRTTLAEAALATEIRAALRRVDPNLPVTGLLPVQSLVDRAVSPRRFVVVLLAGFAGFALVLASLGIYAVISQLVQQRTQEIGIRMALGATAADVQRRVLVGTLGHAVLGIAIGLFLSRVLTTALAAQLFGVTPGDPVTFAAMAGALTFVAALAGYLPALRASRIDPMTTLRSS
jgi:predicted permease